MTAIQCVVEPIGTRLLVRVAGELSVASAPRVRAAVLKCLVEQPDAVVVDLADMVVAEPAAASVFLAAARQATLWPGTPLLIVAPPAQTALLLGGGYGRLALFDSVDAALRAKPRHPAMTVSEVLLPASGAVHRARNIAAEACARWDLPHLVDDATLIANELVSNAVEHAGTMLNLRLSLGRRYLVVAVRDGCATAPARPRAPSTDPAAAHGLLLVEATAIRWGSLPADDGKVVWATLPRQPRPGRGAGAR